MCKKKKIIQQPTTTQLLMSDAIKHECGIALLRLKTVRILQRKYGSAFYGYKNVLINGKTTQSQSRWCRIG